MSNELWVRTKNSAGAIILVVGVMACLVSNAWLIWKLRVPQQVADVDPTGTIIEPIEAVAIDGRTVTLSFGNVRETVVYFLSPDCSFCLENHSSIVALSSWDRRRKYVGIAPGYLADPEALAQHLRDKPLPFPVFRVNDKDWLRRTGLTGTPATLVADARAMVIRYWRGAYSNRRKDEIQSYFGVTLPTYGTRLQ